jgi:hypothetical protein
MSRQALLPPTSVRHRDWKERTHVDAAVSNAGACLAVGHDERQVVSEHPFARALRRESEDHSDAKVVNRKVKVWHGATEKAP